MARISSRSVIAMTAVAGAVIVGAAVWYKYGSTAVTTTANTPQAAVVVPLANEETAAAPETTETTVQKPQKPAAQSEDAVSEPALDETPRAAETDHTDQLMPSFDEVRREDDGLTIIAGSAAPGAEIRVRQDGEIIATTQADSTGKFAAIIMVAPDGKGHVLSLEQVADGQTLASVDQIILAPIEAPVEVAEAAVPRAAAAIGNSTSQPETDVQPQNMTASAAVAETSEASQPAVAEAPTTPLQQEQQTNQTDESGEESATVTAAEAASPDAASQPAAAEATSQTEQPDAATQTVQSQAASQTAEAETATSEVTAAQEAGEDRESTAVPTQEVADTPANTAEIQTADARPAPTAPTAEASSTPDREEAETTLATAAAEVETAAPNTAPTPTTQPAEVAVATPQADTTAPIAVLKATQDGVELLNVPRPEAMENVALDTISYSDTGSVQLSGRAQSETRNVRVYLDNNAVVSLKVDDQGRWRGDLPNVDEGIYTLRVDEVAEDGSVTSRVETPFKREAPAVLAEAAAAQDGPLRQITVQKGATLWAIARDRYGDGLLYVNVFKANSDSIRDPDLIYPGQVFSLPGD